MQVSQTFTDKPRMCIGDILRSERFRSVGFEAGYVRSICI